MQGLLEPTREMELTHARCLRHVPQPEMIANVTIQKILYSAKSRSAQTVDSPPCRRSIHGDPVEIPTNFACIRGAGCCKRSAVA